MAPINNISFLQGHQPERTCETRAVEHGRVESQNGASDSVCARDQAGISVEEDLQLAGLRAGLEQVPEARQVRVEYLQRALQDGTYKVSNEQIAEALLSELTG